MPGSFVERKIDLIFELGTGSFGSSGKNQINFQGLRIEMTMENAGLPSPGAVIMLRVYGLTLSQINDLSKAGLLWDSVQNKLLIKAGDSEKGMAEIFNGEISEAYPDFEQPSSPLVVFAYTGIGLKLKPVDPVSIDGSISGEQALTQIVKPAGLTVENSGVDVQLSNPYFPGSTWDQISRCIQAMDCFAYYDSTAKKIAIWPKNKGRQGGGTPLISPETGMIGYPKFQKNQIIVRTLLDTSIKQGTDVRVKCGLAAADGTWHISSIYYTLASQMPDGPWEMTITANHEGVSGSTPTTDQIVAQGAT